MIYLNDHDIKNLDLNWDKNIKIIADATRCIESNDISQPIKPYLRYGDSKNRIIAMPAFVGGEINMSGIKWIASFPENVKKGMARAHSVVILNDSKSGLPLGILNSGTISAIRTASVSGLIIKQFLETRKFNSLKLGIVGFGPIGQYHLSMCSALAGARLEDISLYDINGIKTTGISDEIRNKVTIVESWQEAYMDADIFITCTVSKERYIDKKPKEGSLHLNVSLRDYKSTVFPWFSDAIVVDDWEEVCRENTDIEMFHKIAGLQKQDVRLIQDFLTMDYISSLPENQPIMFNPMGMGVFDIALSSHYLELAEATNRGVLLDQ